MYKSTCELDHCLIPVSFLSWWMVYTQTSSTKTSVHWITFFFNNHGLGDWEVSQTSKDCHKIIIIDNVVVDMAFWLVCSFLFLFILKSQHYVVTVSSSLLFILHPALWKVQCSLWPVKFNKKTGHNIISTLRFVSNKTNSHLMSGYISYLIMWTFL